MTGISTTFTISTVEFIDGPYQAPNIGEVVDIAAGTTSVSEVGFPPAPPAPGTPIAMDDWTALTESGGDYTVATAASAAASAGITLTATATSLTWAVTDTAAATSGSVVLAPADAIPSAGAPVSITFTLDLPASLAWDTSVTLLLDVRNSADNPGDHIGATIPVPTSIVTTYAYRTITGGTDLQQVGITDPHDVTVPVEIVISLTAGGIIASAGGSAFYTAATPTAADAAAGVLLTFAADWSGPAGAAAYSFVLRDMSWSAP